MPPVREASTKPIAATVLPAPVACSNQKRLWALGSSGASGELLVVGLLLGVPVEGLLVVRDLLVDLLLAGDRGRAERRRARRFRSRLGRHIAVAGATAAAVAVRPALGLGEQRGQRAGERVDLVRVEQRAVGELRLLVGEDALEAEHQREVAPPLGRRVLRARVDLGERVVERAAPGAAGARAPPRRPRRGARRARARTSRRGRASPDQEA